MLAAKVRVPAVTALARPRLERLLQGLWDRRVGVVVAPAGSGKTTLLAQFAAAAAVPVAWYRAEASDVSEAHLLVHLERSLVDALGVPGGWTGVDQAVTALERWPGERALLVLDDLHTVRGTPAELALGRLLDVLPPAITVLAASRRMPDINLTRLRLAGDLLEVVADDLRFRAWEIERLFRDHYREPMLPEDMSALGRHTEGWAAGLQLFHLATTGRPSDHRRRILDELASRSRLVREYLARNVLDELPEEARRFLVDTCVLGVLTGPLCDEFLESTGSGAILEYLERHQIFTLTSDDGVTYRYHEVLRSYLEGTLVARVGETEVRRRLARAAALLEASGATSEALRAYCRAEDWDSVGRLLGRRGEELAGEAGAWLEALPPFLVDGDPWLLLATARRHRASGRLAASVEAYRKAQTAFRGVDGEDCERERLALALWAEPMPAAAEGWVGALRRATQRNPAQAAREAEALPATGGAVAAALATLLAGQAGEAARRLDSLALDPKADPRVSVACSLAATVARVLRGGSPARPVVEDQAGLAEQLGVPWLARVARASLRLTEREGTASESVDVAELCRADDDRWGAALVAFLQGLADLQAGTPDAAPLEQAADAFGSLGAGVLEAWCRSFAALAQGWLGHPGARASALTAEALARSAMVRGAQAVAFAALAAADSARGGDHRAMAESIADECGLVLFRPPPTPERQQEGLRVRCLGGFDVTRNGGPVDLGAVKPRARSVLHLLAVSGGRPVHWEVLTESLWPGTEPRAGARNLQVAVSSLRHVLEPDAGPRGSTVLRRQGDAYLLVTDALDVREFEDALDASRAARVSGDQEAEARSLQLALDAYSGDLVPEAGPAEWVVKDRERLRRMAGDAAEALAELLASRGAGQAAASAAERGLAVDPYRDRLWRLLLETLAAADDQAALARARRAYEAVRAEVWGPDPP